MAQRFTDDGDTPDGNGAGASQVDNEVGELLVALNGQIARTQVLIGRVSRLVEEIDQHRKSGPKCHLPR